MIHKNSIISAREDSKVKSARWHSEKIEQRRGWEPRVKQERFISSPFYSDYRGARRADCTFHSASERGDKNRVVRSKGTHWSKCSDNLSRPFVVRHDCTYAQSVRENGNRAKWICSHRKSAWEEGRGRDERGEKESNDVCVRDGDAKLSKRRRSRQISAITVG